MRRCSRETSLKRSLTDSDRGRTLQEEQRTVNFRGPLTHMERCMKLIMTVDKVLKDLIQSNLCGYRRQRRQRQAEVRVRNAPVRLQIGLVYSLVTFDAPKIHLWQFIHISL